MVAGKYEDNHIMVEVKSTSEGERGKRIVYDCTLSGEYVGEIEYIEKLERYRGDNHFFASVAYCDQYENGKTRFRGLDRSFHSLYAARVAMLSPALSYVKERAEQQNHQVRNPVAYLPVEDCEFFPTPSDLAGKLLSGVRWKGIHSVLEPSAGRGDLIEYTEKRNGWNYGSWHHEDLKDVDCIEIDPNLRALLTGKGYRVVHDDFLTYFTRKRYDLIVMNPPFADGDKHLLKALELCEHGGQIACILNAETLRNPYTNSRKLLLRELRRHNASIRYVANAFAHAARRANVDVALINVDIPVSVVDDSLWESMKKAQEQQIEAAGISEIAPANQVDRLIREYNLVAETGYKLIQLYNGVKPHLSFGESYRYATISLKIGERAADGDSEDLNHFLNILRGKYWRMLFTLPELDRLMTTKMREEYSRIIDSMRDYEFSDFNVHQVLERIHKQLCTGVEEAIVKCFDKLSAEHAYNDQVENGNIHYYNGWKTNKAHRVGMKCIIPTWGCFATEYKQTKAGGYKDVYTDQLNVRGCFGVLDDLEKALNYLDNGETVETNLCSTLESAAKQLISRNIPCKYFDVTFYKKGTCHIMFHDEKIVDKLNIFVGRQRQWLPPTYGHTHYRDMDEESRNVVDSFCGKEKYEKIMQNPNAYLVDPSSSVLMLN